MATEHSPPSVGSRLVVGKHKATVRFVGQLEDQGQELWAGLEWDDPSRGKHDGSHAGRRYFACVHHPSAGSFVRLSKLVAAMDPGRSVLEAAVERYCTADAGVEPIGAADQHSQPAAGEGSEGSARVPLASGSSHVEIELVGAEQVAARLARLEALSSAVLADRGVARVVRPRGRRCLHRLLLGLESPVAPRHTRRTVGRWPPPPHTQQPPTTPCTLL